MIATEDAAFAKLVPELQALLGLWRRRYLERGLPDRSRFDAFELEPWARHLCWIEAGPGDRFHIRKFGVDLIRRFGREATGQHIDELAPDIAAGLCEVLWRTVATAAPVMGGAAVPLGREPALFSQLILPLAGDGNRVRHILLASYEITASKAACR